MFEASARIEVELLTPVKVVWLNAKDLDIRAAEISGVRARPRTVGGELLGLELDTAMGPSRSTAISIRYRGRLQDRLLLGAYRRKVEGQWYAYTTFTPIEARRTFPCFDEPRFKTPWELSIRVRRDLKAFSNTAQVSEVEEPGGTKLVRFAPTAPLPSELVAFVVGPFDIYQGTLARVLTPKGHAADGRAGADATSAVLPRLEAYTGIPYPFGKLDHVALPDGAYGAVENPGLITYLASRLLVPPGDVRKTLDLRRLESHEIGHQWFGNLVTQKDWRDVWLSEGFATWISNKVMDQERAPERKALESIVARERFMLVDGKRPVRLEIASRAQAKDTYNPIVYQKGAAILLMLDGWLGESHVRNALRAYLKEHAFEGASTEDLAAALSHETGTDVAPVLASFLDTTGIPRVSAEVLCDGKSRLRIQQTGGKAVPVCFKGDGLERCSVVAQESREIALDSCPSWVYLNSGGSGYYRTEWSAEMLKRLAENGLQRLTLAEKLTLVYDLRAQKGRGGGREILTKLSGEVEPAVAASARATLRVLN